MIKSLLILLFLSLSSAFGFTTDHVLEPALNLIFNPVLEVQSQKNILMDGNTEIRFEDSGSNYIGLKGPITVPSSFTLLLPTADGTDDYCLRTNASAALFFEDCINFVPSNDNRLLRTDTVSGNKFQESGITISDTDQITSALIDSDNNTITNIVNADIKTGAAIARNKLANATLDYVLINDGSGVMSEEQFLDKTRGGTGITSTAIFPASGTVVTETGAQVITLKDYDIGTQTDTSRITLGKETTVNLDALTDKEGTLAYDTTLNTVVVNDGVDWIGISGGGGASVAKVVVEVYRDTAVQTIATATTAVVDWNAEQTDTHNAFDLTTEIFTTPRSGYYNILGGIYNLPTGASPTINSRNVQLELSTDGGSIWAQIDYNRVATTDITAATTQKIGKLGVWLDVGDLIRVRLHNATDQSIDIGFSTGIDARRIVNLHIVSADGAGGVVSEDVIGARASMNHGQVLGVSTLDKMEFDTIENDTHGNFDPTTNYRYTVGAGQAGYYDINYDIAITAGAGVTWSSCQIIINGSGTEVENTQRAAPINTQWYPYSGHSTENLAVGDTVEIFCRSQTGSSTHIITGAIGSTFSVYKKPSSGVAAADLTVVKYNQLIAGSYPLLPALNRVDFEDKVYDDDALVTTGASWLFTADRNMNCTVNVNLIFTTTNTLIAGRRYFLQVIKNGVFEGRLQLREGTTTMTAGFTMDGSMGIELLTGDNFYIEFSHNDTANMISTASNFSARCF